MIRYVTRLGLAVVILLLTGSLSMPAQADGNPVHLVLGAEGAIGWNIQNIYPGQTGTQTMSLCNAGTVGGSIAIWMSELKPESGFYIYNYFRWFDISCEPNASNSQLETNLGLPITINDFPKDASDGSNYLGINRLNPGDTVTLVWQWELPAETGNEAQGCSFSFTISFRLEEFSPTLPPFTAGGGGVIGAARFLEIGVLGEITGAEITAGGTLLKPYVVSDLDDKVTLGLNSGTRVICNDNKVPEKLEVRLSEESPPVPEGMAIVSPVYDITAYAYGSVCQPVTFDPPFRLVISYDPEELPENTLSVFIACYDEEHGWTRLEFPSGFVAGAGKVAALVTHLTPFAVMAGLTPPYPPAPAARFEVRNLDINPNQVMTGERVTISAQLVNIGGLSGEYTLMVNVEGLLEKSQVITLAPGQSQEISFTVTPGSPGSYRVEIGGLRGSFVVEAIPTPPAPAVEAGGYIYKWLIPVILAVLAIAAWAFITLRKRS